MTTAGLSLRRSRTWTRSYPEKETNLEDDCMLDLGGVLCAAPSKGAKVERQRRCRSGRKVERGAETAAEGEIGERGLAEVVGAAAERKGERTRGGEQERERERGSWPGGEVERKLVDLGESAQRRWSRRQQQYSRKNVTAYRRITSTRRTEGGGGGGVQEHREAQEEGGGGERPRRGRKAGGARRAASPRQKSRLAVVDRGGTHMN
jgi:hypothetical protein